LPHLLEGEPSGRFPFRAPRSTTIALSGGGSVGRVVALGASNLTRGLRTLVSTARDLGGPEVEVLLALGLGRSYGARSRVLGRSLPGILQSGLWAQLEALPSVPTRGLITDVGNDILYGSPPEEVLAWVEECAARLLRHTSDVVLTDLPLASLRGLSPSRFLFFRTLFFPPCRLSFDQVFERAEKITAGLETLASARGLRFFRLRPEWYGFDPIHMRPRYWREAWREILCGGAVRETGTRAGWWETLRLYSLFPEKQWLLGIEQVTLQAGVAMRSGGRVWLY